MTGDQVKMEVPPQIRDFAENSVNHAEKAFLTFIEAMKQSATAIPNPATEISKKALSLTEMNMRAAFEHARKLVHAKDMSEAMKIQTEFLQSQFATAREQLKELETSVRSAGEAVTKTMQRE